MRMKREMKRGFQGVASFMIFLIITLPFYVSNVMAVDQDTVNIIRRSGENDVDGFRKSFDTTSIDVEVSPTPARVVQPSQIQAVLNVPGNSPAPFSSCTLTSGSLYSCTYDGITNTLPSGTYNWVVCGVDCLPCNTGTLPVSACRKSTSITIDQEAPMVTTRAVSPSASNGGEATISFGLSDSIGGSSSVCSGIGGVDILYGSILVAHLNVNTTDCTRSLTHTFSSSGFPNGNGTLCIFPSDRVGNSASVADASNCIAFAKDDTPPMVEDLVLLHPVSRAPVTYVGAGTPSLLLSALVTSSVYFGAPTATATISKAGVQAASTSFTCASAGAPGVWNCTSSSFSLPMDATATLDIAMTVTDQGGNVGIIAGSVTVNVDTDQGQVLEIGTEIMRTVNGQLTGFLTASHKNRIYALISESGAGFSGNRVSFNLAGGGSIPATCFSIDPSTWLCENTDVTVAANQDSISGTLQGTDDAGQPVTPLPFTFYIDSEGPTVDRIVLANQGPDNAGQPFFVSGDIMQIKVYFNERPLPAIKQAGMMSDDGFMNATLDLSKVSGEIPPKLPEGCVELSAVQPPLGVEETRNPTLEGQWMCLWTITTPPAMVELKVNLADALGNKPSPPVYPQSGFTHDVFVEYIDAVSGETKEMQVPEGVTPGIQDDLVNPNCWLLVEGPDGLQSNPPTVDAEIASQVGHNVWYPLHFELQQCVNASNEDVRIASINLDPATCTGDTDVIQSAAIVTPAPNSPDAFLKLTVGPAEFTSQTLALHCAMTIVSDLPPRPGQEERRISQPELENFTVMVRLHSIQAMDDAIIEEMKNVLDFVSHDALDIINILNRVITFINQLCNILLLINTINQILATVRVALIPCQGIPLCKPAPLAVDAARSGTDNTATGLMNTFWTVCDYLACRQSFWYGDAVSKFTTAANEKISSFGSANMGGRQILGYDSSRTGRTDDPALFGNIQLWAEPKNSLILSILYLCIPGILFNIMKARQVECQYLNCLASDVPTGTDPSVCVAMRGFNWCMFVYGEIFQIFPIGQILHQLVGVILEALTNIWTIVGLAIGLVCWAMFSGAGNTESFGDEICTLAKLPSLIQRFYNQIRGFFEASSWGFGPDSCPVAIEKAEELISAHDQAATEQEEQEAPPPPPAPPVPAG